MITREKIEELRQRMINHKVVNDRAIAELTARELDDLLYIAQQVLDVLKEDMAKEDMIVYLTKERGLEGVRPLGEKP